MSETKVSIKKVNVTIRYKNSQWTYFENVDNIFTEGECLILDYNDKYLTIPFINIWNWEIKEV